MPISSRSREAAEALAAAAALWQRRLAAGWLPPPGSSYPWAQVKLSLAALLPGMADAGAWVTRAAPPNPAAPSSVALVLAGNTPLMAWSPLCAALLAGAGNVRVKMSRDETLWPRLFAEALAEVAPGVAARVELHDFPGDDPRTVALLADTDAVIAYGSDATVAALRAATPPATPFFGFGHAVSVGVVTDWLIDSERDRYGRFRLHPVTAGFAQDVLMFGQQGCLSPHVLFDQYGGHTTSILARLIAEELARRAPLLGIGAVTDPAIAYRINLARDMAQFHGHLVEGDPELRWTVVYGSRAPRIDVPAPVGFGFVYVTSLGGPAPKIVERFGDYRGRISCVGVAGEVTEELRATLAREGVSRICKPGEMQTPPLDWPNGGVDLLAELLRL